MARRRFEEVEELDERVVDIARVAKVIKGGRRFGFRVVIVVGDNNGRLGMGVGKARTVPDAIRKASEHARRNMEQVALLDVTIPHEIIAEYAGAKVMLKPASRGTGIVAGGGMRAVVEAVGIKDVLAKSLGSSNALNVVTATMKALRLLRSPEEVAQMRGVSVSETRPRWSQSHD
ncbi:MAG: 30S ribosomal protein S5 [Anaerolineae bacterium]|nr:30S ribosomal protein S5 [Anaerolineae bacterium]